MNKEVDTKELLKSFNKLNDSLKEMDKQVSIVSNVFKELNENSEKFSKLDVSSEMHRTWNESKKLLDVIGGNGLVDEYKNLANYIAIYTKLSGNLVGGIKEGTTAFLENKIVVKDASGNIDKFATSINGSIAALTGLKATSSGLGLISSSVKEMSTGTADLMSVIGLVAGTVLTIGGALTTVSGAATLFGVTMSSSMAAATAGVSVVVAGIVGLVAAITSSKDKTSEYQKALDELNETAGNNALASVSQINRAKELSTELQTLVSQNGEVQAGDEARVNYILTKVNEAYGTEYQLINGKIQLNGEEVNSNTELMTSLDAVMEKKKAEAVLNAYQDVYNESLRQQSQILKDATKINNDNTLSEKEKKEKLEELRMQYEDNQSTIKNYEQLEQDVINGSTEAIAKSVKNFYDDSEKTYNEAFGTLKKSVATTKSECSAMIENTSMSVKVGADMEDARTTFNNFGTGAQNCGLGFCFTPITKEFLYNANGGIFSNGVWKNIPQYANGGLPSHGSMFIAGEHGAEIVGHINGRTEVLNRSQIASSIYSAMISAMSQFSGQSSQIDVHVHTDEGTVVDRINQTTKQTGICPINIPL